MKVLVCLGLLLTLTLAYRDLQSDVYKPFTEEELNQIRNPEKTSPSQDQDFFVNKNGRKRQRHSPYETHTHEDKYEKDILEQRIESEVERQKRQQERN